MMINKSKTDDMKKRKPGRILVSKKDFINNKKDKPGPARSHGRSKSNYKVYTSYLQITILIISLFAFCYLIYETGISTVSAQTTIEGYTCCEETLDGYSCEYRPSGECNTDFMITPNRCEDANFCGKKGCCISLETGFCAKNSYQRNCRGEWVEDSLCNIPECAKGCCMIGDQANWVTENECKSLTGTDTPLDFRTNIKSEVECIFLAERDDEGACVFNVNDIKSCMFTTREDCISKTGLEDNFHKDIYCSNFELGGICTPKDYKACIDEKESVYWFDSCGNREEIAEECNLFLGTICGKVGESYGCKDLSCIDKDGKVRKNGESWCEYEGVIDNGRDVVGSRHFRKLCFMGELKTEPCSDYRNQICVQADSDLGNGETFSEAACRINNWRSCFGYNTLEDDEMDEKCSENPDCFVKEIDILEGINFCSPRYPPGFDLRISDSRRSAELVCSFATQNCTVSCTKKLDWKFWDPPEECVNKECTTAKFTKEMNEFCTSLGDCGAYVNYIGDVGDEGYIIKEGSRLSNTYLEEELPKYAIPIPGQKVGPGNLSFLGNLGVPEDFGEIEVKEGMSTLSKVLGGTSGALGVPVLLATLSATKGLGSLGQIAESLVNIASGVTGISPMTLAGFSHAAAASFAGWAFSKLAVNMWSLDGDIVTFVEILGSTLPTLLILAGIDPIKATLITVIVIAIISDILRRLGYGETRKFVVQFKCLPYQPPAGGEKCELCNEHEFCTEYKCRSLGQTCEIINKYTEDEACVHNPPTDISSPRLNPLYDAITEGYEYSRVSIDGFELTKKGGCIDAFTQLTFGIQTDKRAQCKIGTDPLQRYDEMIDYFSDKESNSYLTNHTKTIVVPGLDSVADHYNLTEEQKQEISDINFYIKCKNLNGNFNEAPYKIKLCNNPGPDLTAPRITKTIPETGSSVGYGATEKQIQIYVNEPSECKWSVDDKPYDFMENIMDCNTDIESSTLYGWICSDSVSTGKIYIKCQDTSENQNKMEQSYEYETIVSTSQLIIDEISPANDEEIVSNVEPLNIELRITTSGGAEDQSDTLCEWSGNGYSDFFRYTPNNNYIYNLNYLINGRYTFNFKCEDKAGNIAEATGSFVVNTDTDGPQIIRVYYHKGELKIITDEQGECRYDFNRNFVYENATLMYEDGITHIANWKRKTYYIQCKDEFDNKGGKVSVKVY